jgi:hypothetical protein
MKKILSLVICISIASNLFAGAFAYTTSSEYIQNMKRARVRTLVMLEDNQDLTAWATYEITEVDIHGVVTAHNATRTKTIRLLPSASEAQKTVQRYRVTFIHRDQAAWEINYTHWLLHGE